MRINENHPNARPLKVMTKMDYRALQAACIMRGIDFDDLVNSDWGYLGSWFIKNFDNKVERQNLELFDDWMQEQLLQRGYKKNDPVYLYRKFSVSDDNEVTSKVRTRSLRKADVPKKKHQKKERDKTFNIFKGTKKEYTYKLAESLFNSKGSKYEEKSLIKKFSAQLVTKVIDKYPEAKEKSIKIWMKRALDDLYKGK